MPPARFSIIVLNVIARLDGQSSTYSRCLLDRPVKPGDDSEVCVNKKTL
jgi:hypothetical protein